jgi:hypothetical protein
MQPTIDSITLQFVDGSERTMPIHGLHAFKLAGMCSDFGFKSWAELEAESAKGSLRCLLLAVKVVADALTFPNQEVWSPEKVRENLTDTSVARALSTAMQLSLRDVTKAMGSFKGAMKKPTVYEMG